MSSIFGYIFGNQIIPNNNIKNKKFQVFVAGFMAILSLAVCIISYWTSIDEANSAIGEIRNILFSTVGFLISRVKGDNKADKDDAKEKDNCECNEKK
jgi:hypothetical protein